MKNSHTIFFAVIPVIYLLLPTGRHVLGGEVAQTQPVVSAHEQLGRAVPEFEVKDATFRQAVEGLVQLTHVNMAIRWEDLEGKAVSLHDTLRLHLWSTTVGGALRALLAICNATDRVTIRENDGVIYMMALDQTPGAVSVSVYNIRDLIDAAVEYDRSRVEAANPAMPKRQSVAVALTVEDAVDNITRLIEDNVDTDSWRDNGGSVGVIREFGGLLIVSQTPVNHEKIAAMLRTIRAGGDKDGMSIYLQSATQPAK
ncbi:MAG TPA: hypothetical protein VIM11_28415 [Tepidisphaeraceae bacterium]|jgi:hypothetical protein